jgi:hypothetical protein
MKTEEIQELERRKCVKLLSNHGWKFDCQEDDEIYYSKEGFITVSIYKNVLTFFNGDGDFLGIELSYYGLIGVLVSFRQIPYDFQGVKDDEIRD